MTVPSRLIIVTASDQSIVHHSMYETGALEQHDETLCSPERLFKGMWRHAPKGAVVNCFACLGSPYAEGW